MSRQRLPEELKAINFNIKMPRAMYARIMEICDKTGLSKRQFSELCFTSKQNLELMETNLKLKEIENDGY